MPAQLLPRQLPSAPAPIAIALEPIRIPAQVDQPQWLVRLPDESLASLEQERWASSLRDELRQALLEALMVGYNAVEVHDLSAGSMNAPLRIGVDVRRFDSMPGREARIEGSWTIGPAGAAAAAAKATVASASTTRCDWLFRESAGPGMDALAAAHRRAVTRLAGSIGSALVSLRQGLAPPCAPSDTP